MKRTRLKPPPRCPYCRSELVRRAKLPNVAACQNPYCREFDRPKLLRRG